MWLITGGAYQGKLDYALRKTGIVREKVAEGSICKWEELLKAPLINHFHLWIRRMIEAGKSLEEIQDLADRIIEENPGVVILTDELGCGIVPLDRLDREHREITGRICTRIAGQAESVHRVICGIGTVIKNA